ncbi:hypothetical protein [Psychrobacillus vulpis]|uniref:Uncharacterized protein n=1 Tax=Psychrobacillus vulpis TaxID=2325572 RepID=A0A544TWL3_9BACI|nr:hypothetical protein [Psychrobacillus vulpis]TQR21820.1 hypothetical protein FG384_02420 [Psychrobacillus vulpis]
MTEKVKVPQEVAQAFKDLEVSWNLTEIFKSVTADFTVGDNRIKTLVQWNQEIDFDEGASLMKLLLGQYEVEPQFKPGEKVMVRWLNRDKDALYEILKVNIVEGVSYEVEITGKDGFNIAPISIIRHATPEEIKVEKERQLWKSIGREVGEFREGDTAVTNDEYHYTGLDLIKKHYEEGEIKGFYPAESFINFESEVDSE